MPIFIVATVFIPLIQTLDNVPLSGLPAAVIETTIDTLFLIELALRFLCVPNRRWFFASFYNLIDLAAAAPLAVRMAVGLVVPTGDVVGAGPVFLLCAVPIIRLLKTIRRFEKFHLLLRAFDLAAEALPVLLFILFSIALLFSVLIYLVEPRQNIENIPKAMWFTLVTMTTVGYGDVAPTSVPGSIVAGVLIVITVLYMAIPLGIIGNAFTITWEDRDRILLIKRTHDRLHQWGYSAHHIPALFHISDINGDGELDLAEFRDLITQMRIGFNEERILKLFQSIDRDNDGRVDDRELVRWLFPQDYHATFREEADDEEDEGCGGGPDDPPEVGARLPTPELD